MTSDHLLADALRSETEAALAEAGRIVPRIWERDHTVWQPDPTEVADRLGWLDCPTDFAVRTGELTDFASQVIDDGIEHVLLVGMGGSSLYPDVLARTHGAAGGHPELHVLDSTHPAAVARARDTLPWDRTLLVASSKSGTTTETRSHLDYFWEVLRDRQGDEAGRFVVAVTDPGSALADLGGERGFRRVFTNQPDIGGRFSALSYFGLVPAALLGVDLQAHLATAQRMRERCEEPSADNPGAYLGAVMAASAGAGRDKLTLVLPEDVAPFGDWVEQLVAESTGKAGKGLLPVLDEPLDDPDGYGDDRLFVIYGDGSSDRGSNGTALAGAGHPVLSLPGFGPDGLAAEVFRWEFATAVCGALLDLNPFDQPNVASAKQATSRVLSEGMPDLETTDPDRLLESVEGGDYVAILAYVDPGSPTATDLREAAARLRDRLRVPVTVGIGPRYLHSTGQLHKGGPVSGVFLVVLDEVESDEPVPGRDHSFGELIRAQAAGDLEALRGEGLRAGLVAAEALVAAV